MKGTTPLETTLLPCDSSLSLEPTVVCVPTRLKVVFVTSIALVTIVA